MTYISLPSIIERLTWQQAFFWAVLASLTLTWGYFRLPETKDRTFGEMDILVSDVVVSPWLCLLG